MLLTFDAGPALAAFIQEGPAKPITSGEGGLVGIKEMKYEVSLLSPRLKAVEDELRKSLKAALPADMVPSISLAVREIPLTVSRKVDRAALKKLGREELLHRLSTDLKQDQTRLESKSRHDAESFMREQWKDVLRLESALTNQ